MFRGLPHLLAGVNFTETSPADDLYNCIAWSVGDQSRWWWPHPDAYWPPGVPMEQTRAAFIQAYATLGFAECADGSMEADFEKIAIYGDADGPQHTARQLPDGRWTSKLGHYEDITHDDLESLYDSIYGRVICFMRRAKR
jgi:hypothetical protein